MKTFLKIFNLIFFIVCAIICVVTTILKIVAIMSGLEILVPFTLAFCYVSLCLTATSLVLNFVTYSVVEKNKTLVPSLIFFALALLLFIVSFFA